MYPTVGLLIDGKIITDRLGEAIENPATGDTLAHLPHATDADLGSALEAADRAFAAWSATTALARSHVLRAGADLVRNRVDTIARTMTLEQGKPLAEARVEVLYAADVFDWYAEEGKRAYGRIIPSRNPGVRQSVLMEPVGVAAAFTPWNFPALTPARKIGGALAAGCTLILKAAETTPGTAFELARALHDAGLPSGVLNLVFGDPARVSSQLIGSDIVRKISFTGSVGVGKSLMRLAADGLKRSTMELGGHAPVLVFADSDVDAAAAALAAGKYRNAGQVCVSPTRFYVQDSAYDLFVDKFVQATEALKVGDPLADGTVMGPLASAGRVDAMERLVADAVAHGGAIRTGGNRIGNAGHFFAPTVVTDLSEDALLLNEEPFGPIAPIVRFVDTDEVIDRANRLPFGLAAYVFTQSSRTAQRVGDQLKAGMVGINTLAISTPETPFGGVRDSGHGQEGGIEGLQAYLDVKFIAHAH